MTQVREEVYLTRGRVIVRGKTVKRGESKKADYLLSYKPNLPLAVVEAKDNNHSVGDGMQQALEQAEILDVPFAYSSNGDAFLEHDRTVTSGPVTREIPLEQFPTPEELWTRYCQAKGFSPAQTAVAIDERFYSSVESALDELAVLLRGEARELYPKFCGRLAGVEQMTDGICWGFHDFVAGVVGQLEEEFAEPVPTKRQQ